MVVADHPSSPCKLREGSSFLGDRSPFFSSRYLFQLLLHFDQNDIAFSLAHYISFICFNTKVPEVCFVDMSTRLKNQAQLHDYVKCVKSCMSTWTYDYLKVSQDEVAGCYFDFLEELL